MNHFYCLLLSALFVTFSIPLKPADAPTTQTVKTFVADYCALMDRAKNQTIAILKPVNAILEEQQDQIVELYKSLPEFDAAFQEYYQVAQAAIQKIARDAAAQGTRNLTDVQIADITRINNDLQAMLYLREQLSCNAIIKDNLPVLATIITRMHESTTDESRQWHHAPLDWERFGSKGSCHPWTWIVPTSNGETIGGERALYDYVIAHKQVLNIFDKRFKPHVRTWCEDDPECACTVSVGDQPTVETLAAQYKTIHRSTQEIGQSLLSQVTSVVRAITTALNSALEASQDDIISTLKALDVHGTTSWSYYKKSFYAIKALSGILQRTQCYNIDR